MQTISPQLQEEYKTVFELIDRNSDGKLQTEELTKLITQVENTKNKGELKSMISKMGIPDGSDIGTFCQGMIDTMKMPTGVTEQQILDAFKTFDAEETGIIKVDDLMSIIDNVDNEFTDLEKEALYQSTKSFGDDELVIEYNDFTKKMFEILKENTGA